MQGWQRASLALLAAAIVAACGDAGSKASGRSATTTAAGQQRTPESNAKQQLPTVLPDNTPKPEYPLDGILRLNQIQFKGTHNSYHVQPANPAPDEMYTLPPLGDQLETYGMRGFELDIHYYAGSFWVYHLPVSDPESTCPQLAQCLAAIRKWSDGHRNHQPLLVYFDPRDEYDADKIADHLDELDAALLASFPRDRIVTPDDVIGTSADLQSAIVAHGWPILGAVRGKIMFVLWSFSDMAWHYARDGQSLAGRVMFVAATAPGWRHAMILGMDTAQVQEADIASAVRQRYFVRTRADDEPGRGGDFPARAQDALNSGAQAILTDYPQGLPGYVLTIPGGTPSRCNPLTAPTNCTPGDVEH